MINYIRKKYLNRRVIQQYYFALYHKFFLKDNIKDLFELGYSIYDRKFSFEGINLKKYLEYPNYNFVLERKKLETNDLIKIYKILNEIGVISVLKEYLVAKFTRTIILF